MTTAEPAGRECCSTERETPRLEDLIPIAVVVAAGCESCAERMVRRAQEQGSPKSLIERTLGIVAHLRSLECLAQAVGPEVIARMEKPLEAGRKTLRGAVLST
jgi:alkylhydroperoxidase/carboxymuconolactone decarboxylase family protein YurZ